MKIAITGSSGFVGRHLARTLATEGHDLVLVSRRTGLSVTDPQGLTEAFAGCEVVIHCDSHSIHSLPLFATVGIVEKPIRPLAIQDLVSVLRASAVDSRLSRKTVAIVGPEQLFLSEAVRRVASLLSKRVLVVPCPVALQFMFAHLFEWTMTVPLVSKAQVRILQEGVVEPALQCDPLPDDLKPHQEFIPANILAGLPLPGRFGIQHLRCCARKHF